MASPGTTYLLRTQQLLQQQHSRRHGRGIRHRAASPGITTATSRHATANAQAATLAEVCRATLAE